MDIIFSRQIKLERIMKMLEESNMDVLDKVYNMLIDQKNDCNIDEKIESLFSVTFLEVIKCKDNISVRLLNKLNGAGLFYLRDIIEYDIIERKYYINIANLIKIKGVGDLYIDLIIEKLLDFGIQKKYFVIKSVAMGYEKQIIKYKKNTKFQFIKKL